MKVGLYILFISLNLSLEFHNPNKKLLAALFLLPWTEGTYQEDKIMAQNFQLMEQLSPLNDIQSRYNFKNQSINYKNIFYPANVKHKGVVSSQYNLQLDKNQWVFRDPTDFSLNDFKFIFNNDLNFFTGNKTVKTANFSLDFSGKTWGLTIHGHWVKFQQDEDTLMMTTQSQSMETQRQSIQNKYNKIHKIFIDLNRLPVDIITINEIFYQWLPHLTYQLWENYCQNQYDFNPSDCGYLWNKFKDKKFVLKDLKSRYDLLIYELTGKNLHNMESFATITIHNQVHTISKNQLMDLVLFISEIINENGLIMDKKRFHKSIKGPQNSENLLIKMAQCHRENTCDILKKHSWQWAHDINFYPVGSLSRNFFFLESSHLFHSLNEYFYWHFTKEQDFFLITAQDGFNFLKYILEPLYKNSSMEILYYDGKESRPFHHYIHDLMTFQHSPLEYGDWVINGDLKNNLVTIIQGLNTMMPQENIHQLTMITNFILKSFFHYMGSIDSPCVSGNWHQWILCWWNQGESIMEKDLQKILKINHNKWVLQAKYITEHQDIGLLMKALDHLINFFNGQDHSSSWAIAQGLLFFKTHWGNPSINFMDQLKDLVPGSHNNQGDWMANTLDFLKNYNNNPWAFSIINQSLWVQHPGNLFLSNGNFSWNCIQSNCSLETVSRPIKLMERFFHQDPLTRSVELFYRWDQLLLYFWAVYFVYQIIKYIKFIDELFWDAINYNKIKVYLKKIKKWETEVLAFNGLMGILNLYRIYHWDPASPLSPLYPIHVLMAYILGVYLFLNIFIAFPYTYHFFLLAQIFIVINILLI